ncbi:MAG: aldo/keto reductase, partial [Longimicrobiales bacterium]
RAHGRSAAQVLIRYDLQKDVVVLAKSAHRDRIRENADVFDFELTVEEMERLDGLDEGLATGWDPTDAP